MTRNVNNGLFVVVVVCLGGGGGGDWKFIKWHCKDVDKEGREGKKPPPPHLSQIFQNEITIIPEALTFFSYKLHFSGLVKYIAISPPLQPNCSSFVFTFLAPSVLKVVYTSVLIEYDYQRIQHS